MVILVLSEYASHDPALVIKPGGEERLGTAPATCFSSLQPTDPSQTLIYSPQREMATIKVGDTVPAGKFATVYYTPELADGSACGVRE